MTVCGENPQGMGALITGWREISDCAVKSLQGWGVLMHFEMLWRKSGHMSWVRVYKGLKNGISMRQSGKQFRESLLLSGIAF